MISIGGGQQVMLKVRIAEMNRNVAKQFGVDLTSAAKIAGVPGVISTSNPFGLMGKALSDLSGGQIGQACSGQFFPDIANKVVTGVTGGIANSATTGFNTQLLLDDAGHVIPLARANPSDPLYLATGRAATDSLNNSVTSGANINSTLNQSNPVCANNAQGTLKALEQVGLVHMLAEPNLTAVSGETARFLAGGEFPVPASRDRDGNITVQFKQFGVGLSFTPVVLAPGRISLQLSSEVSELTNAGSFMVGTSVNGLTIPALSVRRAQTTVELPSGGSFAVAGLMQHNTKQVLDGFPGVKDLPVLGALFRSRDFADNQTELVVLISAYLVEPNAESAFVAPTDGFVAPTDPETLLLGRLNATYKKKDEAPVSPQASAPVGFVVR
jgi:pilus assembly protein CpaC